jgi:hypothetical protein
LTDSDLDCVALEKHKQADAMFRIVLKHGLGATEALNVHDRDGIATADTTVKRVNV